MRKIAPTFLAAAFAVSLVACSSSGKSAAPAVQTKACGPLNQMTATIKELRANPATAPTQAAKLKSIAAEVAANPPTGQEAGAKAFAAQLTAAANKLTAPTDSAGVEATVGVLLTPTNLTASRSLLGFTEWAIVYCTAK
jgi:hypothetical protein